MKSLIKAMQAYDLFKDERRKETLKKKEELAKKYGGGTYYQEQCEALEQEEREATQEATDSLRAKFAEKFDGMKADITNYILTPAPDDLMKIMQVYNNGVKPSKTEVQILSEKYGDNYQAKRVIFPYTGQSVNLSEVALDNIMEELEARKQDCEDWIKNYNSGSYGHRLLIAESEPQPLLILERNVNAFLEGETPTL